MFPKKHCLVFWRVLPCLPSCLHFNPRGPELYRDLSVLITSLPWAKKEAHPASKQKASKAWRSSWLHPVHALESPEPGLHISSVTYWSAAWAAWASASLACRENNSTSLCCNYQMSCCMWDAQRIVDTQELELPFLNLQFLDCYLGSISNIGSSRARMGGGRGVRKYEIFSLTHCGLAYCFYKVFLSLLWAQFCFPSCMTLCLRGSLRRLK